MRALAARSNVRLMLPGPRSIPPVLLSQPIAPADDLRPMILPRVTRPCEVLAPASSPAALLDRPPLTIAISSSPALAAYPEILTGREVHWSRVSCLENEPHGMCFFGPSGIGRVLAAALCGRRFAWLGAPPSPPLRSMAMADCGRAPVVGPT
jgi:hypothetical protein